MHRKFAFGFLAVVSVSWALAGEPSPDVKRKADLSGALGSLLTSPLQDVSLSELERVSKQWDEWKLQVPDDPTRADIDRKLRELGERVRRYQGLQSQIQTAQNKLGNLTEDQRVAAQDVGDISSLFPGVKENAGAIRCNAFDSAGKPASELFADSGYSQREIEAFSAYEAEFGNVLPGVKCVSGAFTETPDAYEELEALERRLSEERLKEPVVERKYALSKQIGALRDLRETLASRLERQKEQISALDDIVEQYYGLNHRDRWADHMRYALMKREAARNKIFPVSCIPCEEKHRNDLLLFLGTPKHLNGEFKRMSAFVRGLEPYLSPHGTKQLNTFQGSRNHGLGQKPNY